MEFQIPVILVALVDIKLARVKLICDLRFNSRTKKGRQAHLNIGFNLELISSLRTPKRRFRYAFAI